VRGDAGLRHRSDPDRTLARAQRGGRRALDQLFRRELPALRCWARTRVPRHLWPRADVDDFVQSTFIRALRRYHQFDLREGATFQHYLRRIFVNLVRDELRSVARLPERLELVDVAAQTGPNALDLLLGKEAQRRYRAALAVLSVRTRNAVTARLEHGRSYEWIAQSLGAANAGTARALVARGVTRLTAEMRRRRIAGRHPAARAASGRSRR
jgi:RNA polymerase sigma factor (sigma-70 family)